MGSPHEKRREEKNTQRAAKEENLDINGEDDRSVEIRRRILGCRQGIGPCARVQFLWANYHCRLAAGRPNGTSELERSCYIVAKLRLLPIFASSELKLDVP